MILPKTVSPPSFSVWTSITPLSFKVPTNTSSPTFLSTGIDSPVMEASFMAALPFVMTPSTAIFSPVWTWIMSPFLTFLMETSTNCPSTSLRHLCGTSFTSSATAFCVFIMVMSSRTSPMIIMNATRAPDAYSAQ